MLNRRRFLVAAGAMAAGRVDVQGPPVHAADRFVESVGVCTHLESPPYRPRFDQVLRMIASLGVRHVRDELRPGNDLARWRRLFTQSGIRLQLLVSPATNTVPQMMAFVRALAPGAVSAIEGQNEGDSPWFRAQPCARSGWAEVVIDYQRSVFEAVRGGFGTAVPVVSPSVLDYRPQDMLRLRAAAPFCDVVALHAYLQGWQQPETQADFAGIDWYLRQIRDPFKPGAPAMVTETGYPNGAAGLSPRASGIYLPRLLLHLFERGIARSFIYELMDEGSGGGDLELHYGLLQVDGAAKPAFHALRLLMGALADPGPDFTPSPVALAVTGPPDLRVAVFGKRGGEVVVALWRAVRAWDPAERRDLFPKPAAVRLSAASRPASTLRLESGATWSDVSGRGGRLEFEAGETVTLVRLSA